MPDDRKRDHLGRPLDHRGFPLCECGSPVCSVDYSPDHLCWECWQEEKADTRHADHEWRRELEREGCY